jgi:hypothetical protein
VAPSSRPDVNTSSACAKYCLVVTNCSISISLNRKQGSSSTHSKSGH